MDNMMSERDLVLSLKNRRVERKEIEAKLDEIKYAEAEAETALIEYLESIGASQSAKYDGIGSATMVKPRLFASCSEENFDKLRDYLIKNERADLIKEKVMPQTLSVYVAELVEQGREIPEFISYYLKQSVRIYNKGE
jgi:hypothetical protein